MDYFPIQKTNKKFQLKFSLEIIGMPLNNAKHVTIKFFMH